MLASHITAGSDGLQRGLGTTELRSAMEVQFTLHQSEEYWRTMSSCFPPLLGALLSSVGQLTWREAGMCQRNLFSDEFVTEKADKREKNILMA